MSRPRAYAQLVRLPALPTALADIGLGALATGSLLERWPIVACLAVCSGCLYSAGMVWNDYFDVEQDRRERPERPIPSGRINLPEAARFAVVLMLVGVGFGWLADLWRGPISSFRSAPLALALVAAIFLYDARLKRTALGPLSMGLCRGLNVLLGLSAGSTAPGAEGFHLAGVVALYIVGVTWFARSEARESRRSELAAAAAVIALALVLALPAALHRPPGSASMLFPFLLIGLGFYLGPALRRAIERPTPPRVQSAVRRALTGLIVLDAALAAALVGSVGLALLVLLGPAVVLNTRRWLYAT